MTTGSLQILFLSIVSFSHSFNKFNIFLRNMGGPLIVAILPTAGGELREEVIYRDPKKLHRVLTMSSVFEDSLSLPNTL